MQRLPDFIIGGAPRSGTTWLYELLNRHPRVYMARPSKPEPKFFLVDQIYEKGLSYYCHWFADAAPDQLAGEKTTNYLESPVAARRIRKHLPKVKLIFILRDPVERAYSNYLWSRMNGLEHEEFLVALDLEEKREFELPDPLRFARPHAYFGRGQYSELLRPYFDLFAREQILCLRFEDLIEDRDALIAKLAGFLNIEPRPQDDALLGIVNPAAGSNFAMPGAARRRLAAAYVEPNRRLARLLGHGFKIWEYDNDG
jgi:hypothetical protein